MTIKFLTSVTKVAIIFGRKISFEYFMFGMSIRNLNIMPKAAQTLEVRSEDINLRHSNMKRLGSRQETSKGLWKRQLVK
jgi:hypothetical protein